MVQNNYKSELIYVGGKHKTFQKAKCFNTSTLFTTDPLFFKSSIRTGSISFF